MHFGLLSEFKRNKIHLQKSCPEESPVNLGRFCSVLQAAVLTCSSQPEFTLERAIPAGWWRGPWSSWWALIPLLSSWGNVSSSRLCPCSILMGSSMASELWLVPALGFVCAPSRSHLQCLCWENSLCPVFYSSCQSCVENVNLRHGLVCCPEFVRCMRFCTVCGQISQFPGRSETGSLLTNGGFCILLKQWGRIQLQSRKTGEINALCNLVGGGWNRIS